MTSAVRLRLFKLRVFDNHCHIVASHDDRGMAIDLPGVDLRGAEAATAFEIATPLIALLRERSDGGQLRAASLHLERRRVLATFEPRGEERKPAVVRIDGEAFEEALEMARAVVRYLSERTASRLASRRDLQADHVVDLSAAPAPPALVQLTPQQLQRACNETLHHYSSDADAFWQGTRDHDVSQNIGALLQHIPGAGPHTILDLGCGPGRDLRTFHECGQVAVGLDGAAPFVRMARAYSGCEVLHQSFLRLDLPAQHFDGIFANASLFHVPSQELPRVLGELRDSLKDGGILLASNPRGPNREGWSTDRYCCFFDLETFSSFMKHAGFDRLDHYYRPPGQPRDRQPWLVSVWRRAARSWTRPPAIDAARA